MNHLFMQQPFLPTYDFDDIPTDEEIAVEKLEEAYNPAGPGIWPFPVSAPKKVADLQEEANKKFFDMLKEVEAAPIKKITPLVTFIDADGNKHTNWPPANPTWVDDSYISPLDIYQKMFKGDEVKLKHARDIYAMCNTERQKQNYEDALYRSLWPTNEE